MFVIANVKVLYKRPRIREDRGEGNRFCKSNNGCTMILANFTQNNCISSSRTEQEELDCWKVIGAIRTRPSQQTHDRFHSQDQYSRQTRNSRER